MATPKKFRGAFGVLNIGMGLVTVIYVGMAMMGYWKYGDKIEPSITLNFPKDDPLAQSIKILYSIAIFISYGLQGYVPVQIIWTNYIVNRLEESNKKLFWEYVLRLMCVIITYCACRPQQEPTGVVFVGGQLQAVMSLMSHPYSIGFEHVFVHRIISGYVILATTVPLLGLFISLVGAFCLSALGIAFPAIIELCAYWPDKLGPGRWILIKDILLIIVGIVGLCAGSYSCIFEIVRALTSGPGTGTTIIELANTTQIN